MDLHVSVQDGATLYTRVLCLTVLTLSIVLSQRCTTAIFDPQNVSNYDPSRLVPLRGLHDDISYTIPGPEQWIFPDLQFTCYGQVIKWIFAGVPGQTATPCIVEIETWRLNAASSNYSVIYDKIGTTETSDFTITQDGLIFTYELALPMVVEPGDTVGVVLKRSCIDYDNILGLNINGTGSTYYSYGQAGLGLEFNLRDTTSQKDFIPLIEALVEPFQEITTSIESITTLSAVTVMTHPEILQSEPGGTSASTIAGAIVGATIGVIIIATAVTVVCICIIRYNKERQKLVADKQQEQHQHENSKSKSGLKNVTVMSMQQCDAYIEPRVYHGATPIGIAEQDVQLNQAYGVKGKGRVGRDEVETEDEYEKIYDAQELEEYANPNEYELSPPQQEGNMDVHVHTENTDEIYECI